MCEPIRGGIPLALLLLATVAERGSGQTAAEFQARIAALSRAVRQAEIADSLWLTHQPVERVDTIRIGKLSATVPPPSGPVLAEAMRQAWSRLEGHFGADLGGATPRLLEVSTPDAGQSFEARQVPAPGLPVTSRSIGRTAGELADGLAWFAERDLWARADSSLRHWLGGDPDPGRDEVRMRREAYYDVVTSLSPSSQGCLVGDPGGCTAALSLASAENPVQRLYDAAGRRTLVERMRSFLDRAPHQLDYYACVQEGRDQACAELLELASDATRRDPATRRLWEDEIQPIPPPLSANSRRLFLEDVLATGGPDAWSRLLASAADPTAARMQAAAGVPLDSVLLRWRAALLAARPNPPVIETSLFLLALGWTALLAGLAIWGSLWP